MQSTSHLLSRSTFIFNDSLERVFHCFSDMALVKQFSEDAFLCKLELEEGKTFDDPNAVILSIVDNKVTWKCRVINYIKTEHYYSFTHRYFPFTPSSARTTVKLSFYYNTSEENTLFVMERIFEDPISHLHIGIPLNEKGNFQMCSNIAEYLDQSRFKLQQIESILINHPIETLWDVIAHYDSLIKHFITSYPNQVINNGRKKVHNGDHVSIQIDEACSIKLVVKSLKRKNKKIKVIMELSSKDNLIPKQLLRCFVDKLDSKNCIVTYIHYSLDTVSYSRLCLVKDIKKTALKRVKCHICNEKTEDNT